MSTTNKQSEEPVSLKSRYTSALPNILAQLGISLAVSTYQAGKVILIREDKGTVNTHFCAFSKPMGIAVDGQRLTVGGRNTVWYYREMPALAPKLDPPGRHDTCYLPRQVHFTGDIDIHEMAWGTDGLYLVNTKFCCLCTLDPNHSFSPCWRPHFISALTPEDRCHLNGLAMKNGVPAYVTALGETDKAGAWRDNKRDGGILMAVDDNRILARGLSMPHSPRLYDKRLWFLESGVGGIGWFDPAALHTGGPGRAEHTIVATLPGFTRGLDFVGPLAFIGLSQVRESAVFSGIPLVERLSEEERVCGIWVVDIRSGETLAFLRFESGVQEIFAVQVLPARFPAMLDSDHERMNDSYVLPDDVLRDVPEELLKSEVKRGKEFRSSKPSESVEEEKNIKRLPEYTYREYTLRKVYRQIDSVLAEEIIQMWTDSGLLDQNEAERRVGEVFLIIRNSAGRLNGVVTVYINNFSVQNKPQKQPYWFLRMFIRPGARKSYNLLVFAVEKTMKQLAQEKFSGVRPEGTVIVAENPKFRRKGGHRLFARLGMTQHGQDPQGNEIWYKNFDL